MAGDTPEQGQGRIINGRYRLLRQAITVYVEIVRNTPFLVQVNAEGVPPAAVAAVAGPARAISNMTRASVSERPLPSSSRSSTR